MLRQKGVEFEPVDETVTEKSVTITPASINAEVNIEHSIGYRAEYKEEMSYSELSQGLERGDPGAILFLRIAGGFALGILSGLASIGLFVIASGDTDGYFILGASCFFTILITFIIIEQKMKNRIRNK